MFWFRNTDTDTDTGDAKAKNLKEENAYLKAEIAVLKANVCTGTSNAAEEHYVNFSVEQIKDRMKELAIEYDRPLPHAARLVLENQLEHLDNLVISKTRPITADECTRSRHTGVARTPAEILEELNTKRLDEMSEIKQSVNISNIKVSSEIRRSAERPKTNQMLTVTTERDTLLGNDCTTFTPNLWNRCAACNKSKASHRSP
jgi:hypothetical protein